MSRHRNLKKISLEDELSDDVYGRSYEDYDNYCVSPSTESEYMYVREEDPKCYALMRDKPRIEEEEGEETKQVVTGTKQETEYRRPQLDAVSQAKLQTCIEKLEDILGDTFHEGSAINAIIGNQFDVNKAVNELLNKDSGKTSSNANKTSGVLSDKRRNAGASEQNPFKKLPSPKQQRGTPLRLEKADKGSDGSKNSSGSLTPKVISRSESFEDVQDGVFSASKTPRSAVKREVIDVTAELKKRNDGKSLLNLVVIGHVDAGKSTLMGHLLYKLGKVSQKAMHKNETESRKLGKGSFAFAWVLDETEEERARGITMDVAMTMFETQSKIITLMDAPGHRDFIPNMIQGTAQADVAILVVDSRPGEFEAGFESGGQTREHALLARSLGVGQMIVAVNKMDAETVLWSRERYDEIVIKLKAFLTKQAGFKESDVVYVPCSGLSGENLTARGTSPTLTSWYQKNCLVEQIDQFRAPERPIDKPFRLSVSDVYKGQGSGFMVAGKVESGSVQNGDRVTLMPANETGVIKGLTCRDEPVKFVAAGDHVVAMVTGVDMAHVTIGSVVSEVDRPIRAATRVVSRLVVFNVDVPITKGFMVVFHSQNLSEPAVVSKLVSVLNKTTGEILQNRPRCISKQMNAVVELKFSRPVCVELFKDNKVLGRFMLRYSGHTIAAGVLTEIK